MRRRRTAVTLLGVLLLAGPTAAGQADMLDSSEAEPFMGEWIIDMDFPGSIISDQTVTIRDEGGRVAARLALRQTGIGRRGGDPCTRVGS